MDWTQISQDPNNPRAKGQVAVHLQRLRAVHLDCELMDVVRAICTGKRVLDIGVVSHVRRYVDSPQWRHRQLKEVAEYILGVDILPDLIAELGAEGYNVRVADATSGQDLGERFDVVFIGDVIEHVDNPGLLLAFASRHLTARGCILVATPNPFSRKFVRQFLREGVMVTNLDHVAWFTAGMAGELARRQGIELSQIHLAKRYSMMRKIVNRFLWRFPILRSPVEYSFPDYLFEFKRKSFD